MKDGRRETVCYTVEREFLAKINVAELVNRIIQTHLKKQNRKSSVKKR